MGRADPNHMAATDGRRNERPRTALVLYGSETGNAQDVAEEIGRLAERLRFDATVLDMDSVQLRDLVRHSIVIFAISTTGQGEFPQNARGFWKALLSSVLKPGLLRKVRFTSFGIGDSSYTRYNTAHRMLFGRLVQLGAQPFCGRGEGNEQHPEGHTAGFVPWIVDLEQRLLENFPLPDGESPIPEDAFIEPRWKLDFAHLDNSQHDGKLSNGSLSPFVVSSDTVKSEEPLESSKSGPHNKTYQVSPSSTPLPIRGAYTATLLQNERVTTQSHFQDVRLLDFRIDQPYEYGPGAIAVIYPKNFPQDVDDFIHLMQWQAIADTPVILQESSISLPRKGRTAPSPLRHLDLSRLNTPLTLRWLLENVLDIMSIPRRSFFAALARHLTNETNSDPNTRATPLTEDEEYQKARLLELANPQLIDELWDYTTRPKRTLLEALQDFTHVRLPWQYVLTTIPLMRGRQFSIASAHSLDALNRTKVELLVAIADPPSPIIKYRRRHGVCTRYIASLVAKPDQPMSLTIGLQQGYLDVQPSETDVPVLMIGPGTGVAPMRSMIYQRLAWRKAKADTSNHGLGKHLQNSTLIFGCRSSDNDNFFADEWACLTEQEGLTVWRAFSRDPKEPRQYVQDVVRAHSAEVHKMLFEDQRGKVYVCGSAGGMPKGVREALVDVWLWGKAKEGEGEGEGMRDEAESCIERLEREGRYKQETW